MKEVWRPVKDFPGYLISNLGRLKSLKRKSEIIKEPSKYKKQRYISYSLTRACDPYTSKEPRYPKSWEFKTKNYNRFAHRLVAEAFIKKPKNKNQVNHKDGNPFNNRVDNLEWVDASENQKHAIKMGLTNPVKGSKCSNAKLSEKIVREIRKIPKPFPLTELSKKYGVGKMVLYRAYKGITWKHVK